jgi:hypothetical protein
LPPGIVVSTPPLRLWLAALEPDLASKECVATVVERLVFAVYPLYHPRLDFVSHGAHRILGFECALNGSRIDTKVVLGIVGHDEDVQIGPNTVTFEVSSQPMETGHVNGVLRRCVFGARVTNLCS